MSTILQDDSAVRDPSKQMESVPPPLAALFLIKFDVKVGYSLAWYRSIHGVTLEGVVEYKSLPSGLHNVKEDLIYFVHDKCAGLSAYVNGEGGQEERNARFVAVGVLLPLNDGRLGRAWLHAAELKNLAREIVVDPSETGPLDHYWDRYRIHDTLQPETSDSQANSALKRGRSLSTATVVLTDQTLPPEHPALSVLDYLDTFGPLVFPLHRLALLRKRILLVNSPPVRLACDFVYNISILSSLPLTLSPILDLSSPYLSRFRPLFILGIHDIPFLEQTSAGTAIPNGDVVHNSEPNGDTGVGWVGCTTDEILSLKPKLYDVLVQLPSSERQPAGHPRRWPILKRSIDGKEIKATQRDLRRYRHLRQALAPMSLKRSEGFPANNRDTAESETDESTHLLFTPPKYDSRDAEIWNGDEDKLCEPSSWAALAYSGLMWWASAGEKDEALFEEDNVDQQLLGNLGEVAVRRAERERYHDNPDGDAEEDEDDQHGNDATLETAVIAYFHRLTKQIFENCAEALELPEDEDEEEQDEEVGKLGSDELRRMGLDVWSESDEEFVRQFVPLWFGKDVEVHGMVIECCGVRIC